MSDFNWDLFFNILFFILIVYVIFMTVVIVIAIFDCVPKRKKYFIVHHYFVNSITVIKAKNEKQAVEKFFKQSFLNSHEQIVGIFKEDDYEKALELMRRK